MHRAFCPQHFTYISSLTPPEANTSPVKEILQNLSPFQKSMSIQIETLVSTEAPCRLPLVQ